MYNVFEDFDLLNSKIQTSSFLVVKMFNEIIKIFVNVGSIIYYT